MGTPAYMAPGAAKGPGERERDVGRLLPGRDPDPDPHRPSPYDGDTASEVMRQAIAGDTAPAQERLDACGADKELVDLAQRCLAPAQAARPHDASEVADAVHAYLVSVEERAQQSAVEAAEARVREAGERRARRLTLGLAAAVLLGVLGAGAGFWRADRGERERSARAAQTVGAALEEVSVALGEARKAGSAGLDAWPTVVQDAQEALALATQLDAPSSVRARAKALQDTAVHGQAEAEERAELEVREVRMIARLVEIRDRPLLPRIEELDAAGHEEESKFFEEAFRLGGVDWAGAPDRSRGRLCECPSRAVDGLA